ncbi:TIGR00297 family protein [Methanimicrococcus sp. OttesenSCG-928-J09]|nr:TIGR00297 family protein [Methanimicrococcus sp. OttesenSCG-928-J09]
MNKTATVTNADSNLHHIRTCKLFYLAKYAAGILFILSAAVLPLWLFFAVCFVLCILSMTPLLTKAAALFKLTDENKLKQLSFDFRLLAGILTFSFLAALILENYNIDFPSFLIFQALAVTIFSTRSWYSLFNRVTLYENVRETEKFKNISLLYEFFLIILRVLGAFLAGVWVASFTGYDLTTDFLNQIFFISIIGAFIGSLFESIPSRFNANASIYLGALLSMWALLLLNYQTPWSETALAAFFSVVLAFLAYRYKIADVSALFSAAVLGIVIILFTNLWWFVLLVAFFILGGGFTKYKFRQKKAAGLAESKTGIRSYENVFSNSIWALIIAVLYGALSLYPEWSRFAMPLVFAYVGTIASATGDTMASEIGVTAKGPTYMITNFRKAKPGEDGGVSLLGETAAFIGSAIIGVMAFAFGMIDTLPLALLVSIAGGFLGTNIDSVLGAVLQKRGYLSNSGVNVFSTLSGAIISFALYFLIF